MTDGLITQGLGKEEETPTALYDLIDTLDDNNGSPWDAVIFSYSLGTGSGKEDLKTVPHAIACGHRGIWTGIADAAHEGALRSAMSGYYAYLANGIVSDKVLWSEEYLDSQGLGNMVTAALPIYGTTTNGGRRVIGVVGVDVLTDPLRDEYFDS